MRSTNPPPPAAKCASSRSADSTTLSHYLYRSLSAPVHGEKDKEKEKGRGRGDRRTRTVGDEPKIDNSSELRENDVLDPVSFFMTIHQEGWSEPGAKLLLGKRVVDLAVGRRLLESLNRGDGEAPAVQFVSRRQGVTESRPYPSLNLA